MEEKIIATTEEEYNALAEELWTLTERTLPNFKDEDYGADAAKIKKEMTARVKAIEEFFAASEVIKSATATNIGETTSYTGEGYRKLVGEYRYLKGPKMKEVKEALAAARDLGDLSENSEYDEARNEQAKTVARINELEYLILHAVIVNESEINKKVVHLGSTVKVLNMDANAETEYSIVGTNEVDALSGKISDQSPIGSALLGSKKNDIVKIELPNGKTIDFKVLEVKRL